MKSEATYLGWVVLSDWGVAVPCMDGGATRHHVAVWATAAQAEHFAEVMRRVPGNGGNTYTVEPATVEVVPANIASQRAQELDLVTTPGRWRPEHYPDGKSEVHALGHIVANRLKPDDANFVAEARTLVPRLEVERDQLAARVAELEAMTLKLRTDLAVAQNPPHPRDQLSVRVNNLKRDCDIAIANLQLENRRAEEYRERCEELEAALQTICGLGRATLKKP